MVNKHKLTGNMADAAKSCDNKLYYKSTQPLRST